MSPAAPRSASALSALAQLACLPVSGDAMLDELLLVLRDVVPFDLAAYVAYGDGGQLEDVRLSAGMSQQVSANYVQRWYDRLEIESCASHWRHALSQRRYDCLRISDVMPRLRHTAYFDEVLRPAHLGCEVRLMLRGASRPLGALSIGRATGDFSDAEVALARRALPHLSHAMAQRPLPDASESSEYDADSALLMVDCMGRVQSGSGHAWTLLNRALGRSLTLGTLQDFAHAWAQPFLAGLVQRMQMPQRSAPDQAPLAVQRNRYGTFYLRGYVLEAGSGAPALYGIQIQRRAALEQRLFGSARFRGLTASEREVALRLARGATPGEIAQDLGVKTSTAIFHTRNIYRRLEINQRAQLVSALLA